MEKALKAGLFLAVGKMNVLLSHYVANQVRRPFGMRLGARLLARIRSLEQHVPTKGGDNKNPEYPFPRAPFLTDLVTPESAYVQADAEAALITARRLVAKLPRLYRTFAR